MRIHPLQDRVLVRRLEVEQHTAAGIVIPGAVAEKPDQGVVVAAGSGKFLKHGKVQALGVKVGDKVLFAKYSGHPVTVSGEKLLVMREADIIGVVEG
jgi:chaperonin GroES